MALLNPTHTGLHNIHIIVLLVSSFLFLVFEEHKENTFTSRHKTQYLTQIRNTYIDSDIAVVKRTLTQHNVEACDTPTVIFSQQQFSPIFFSSRVLPLTNVLSTD